MADVRERVAAEFEYIDQSLARLRRHLAFRHFFIHSYPIHLRADRMEPLVESAPAVYAAARADLVTVANRIAGT